MQQPLQRYTGEQIEIIYLDQHGQISKRTIRPLEVKSGRVKAYCLAKMKPRVFLIENILAMRPSKNNTTGDYIAI